MAEDAAHEPGGLPLLQYTLAELFDSRQHDQLTLGDYRGLGGLAGSIGRRAEHVYLELSPEVRAATRAVFLRLVTVDEESEDTRRRVRRRELDRLPFGEGAVGAVLDAFGRARLLTFDRDAATRGPTVELAHEAILREWDRLVGWVDAARDDLLTRRRVEVAAREWNESEREPSYLLGGARLELTEGWHDRTGLELTDLEDEFLIESRNAFDVLRERRRRGRRRVVAGLIAAIAAVSVLGLVALVQGRAAEQRALENRVAELTNEALVAMTEDPDLAILLALEAYETSLEIGEPSSEVVAALQRTVQESRLERVIDDGSEAMAASPDGRRVATHAKDDRRTLRVYDLDSGEKLLERGLPFEVLSVAYSPDGSVIAVAFHPASGRGVSLLDATTFEEVATTSGASPVYLSFSDDGRYMTGMDTDDVSTLIWDVEDDYAESRLEGSMGPPAFLAGSSVLVRSTGERLEYVDPESLRVVDQIELPSAGYSFVTSHPDGDLVAVANRGAGRIDIVSREQGRVVFSLGGFVSPEPMAFTADGGFLVAGGTSPTAIAVELDTKERTLLSGHGGMVTLIEASGDRMLVQSLDRGIRLWHADARGVGGEGWVQFEPGDLFFGEVDPESDRAAAVVLQETVAAASLVEISTGDTINRQEFFWQPWAWPLLSEDGRLVVGLLRDPRLGVVVDLETGESLIELRPCEIPRGVSHAAGLVVVAGDCYTADLEEGSGPGRTGLVSLTDGSLVRPLPLGDEFNMAAVGFPGKLSEDLLLLARGTTLTLIRISTGEQVGDWTPGNLVTNDGILPVGFSPDGAIAYVGYQNGRLAVFDLRVILEGGTMEEALRFERQAHQGALKFAQTAGDSIVTAGAEVKVWDVGTGELRFEIPATSTAVISPDGSAVYYDDGDSLMRRAPSSAADLVELARSRVNRDLTADECVRFLGPEDCTTSANE
jgi:WD40 repeat protein